MKKGLLVIALGGLITLGTATAQNPKWICTLTNRTIEKCCCIQQKDGNLYCTLAKKSIESCCCKAAEE